MTTEGMNMNSYGVQEDINSFSYLGYEGFCFFNTTGTFIKQGESLYLKSCAKATCARIEQVYTIEFEK